MHLEQPTHETLDWIKCWSKCNTRLIFTPIVFCASVLVTLAWQMQHTATHHDVCESEMNIRLETNRKWEAHIAEKLDFNPIKCVFHFNLPTLSSKRCVKQIILCAFTLAKMFFWHTENLLDGKRKHITSIRKCNDILSSATYWVILFEVLQYIKW